MFRLLLKIPVYKLSYHFGFPPPVPLNFTIGVSYKCNSRCRTCNAWKKQVNELSLKEWGRVFRSIGKGPYWFTFSGGEPFLKNDLVEMVKLAYQYCQPKIINIPTNGILWSVIPQKAKAIAQKCPQSQIIINLSLDGVGKQHEEIRRIPGNWEFAMKTWQGLKKIQSELPNLELGIHSVISKFNVNDFPRIYQELIKLQPDSYITEIAEEREELDTVNTDITPPLEKYEKAINFLIDQIQKKRFRGISKVTQAFRINYYQIVKQTLKEQKQVIPCYAGITSAQISPDGEVWPCCIKAESMGNLRENQCDFMKIWHSKKAVLVRKKIKNKECFCPLANASYTNMLVNPSVLLKVIFRLIFWSK